MLNQNHYLTTYIMCVFTNANQFWVSIKKCTKTYYVMTLNWMCDQLRGWAIINILIEMKGSWMLSNGIGSNKEPKLGKIAKKCKDIFMWSEYVW
jgi:hypothetical protein